MKDLKIGIKLFILVGFLVAFLVMLGIASIYFLGSINSSMTDITDNALPSIYEATDADTALSDFRVAEYRIAVSKDEENKIIGEKDREEKIELIDKCIATYQTYIVDDADQKVLDTFKESWQKCKDNTTKIDDLVSENKHEEALDLIMGESKELFDKATIDLIDVVDYNKNMSNELSDSAKNTYATAVRSMLIVLVIAIVVAVILAIYIVRSITSPVSEIDKIAMAIAEGDLNESITYSSKDELGTLAINFNKTVTRLRDYVNYIDEIASVLDEIATGNLVFSLQYDYFGEFAKIKTALNNISESLNSTMTQIAESSGQVSAGSEQLAEGAGELAEGATDQASAIEELLATTTEVAARVKENAKDADSAARGTRVVVDKTHDSKNQMDEMTEAMKKINDTSQQVVSIIQTIEDISSQTNLLALNASIEAARAGEAGKGFAVVANEIGNLADESSKAASNTRDLIELSISEITNGNAIVKNTVESLNQVITSVSEVTEVIDKTKEAAEYQAEAMHQLETGIEQISSVVQSNSATAEESSATSEELAAQADNLASMVKQFKLRT